MNADLMITIAFCLYVSLGSLALAILVAQSIRDDTAKAVEAKRRSEPAERIRQPRPARVAGTWRPRYRNEKQSHAARPRGHRREVEGTDAGPWLPRRP
jgi:hypothetical protein